MVNEKVGISAGHLTRNLLAIVDQPFTEGQFRITIRQTARTLREKLGMRTNFDKYDVSDEFNYWAGFNFLQFNPEANNWCITPEKQGLFVERLDYVNEKFGEVIGYAIRGVLQEAFIKAKAEQLDDENY